MADDTDDVEKLEAKASVTDSQEFNQIRKILADVYTFVRSSEISKTIQSFTLDHYIEEAKREIKDPRVLRAASDPSKGVGVRPSKLERLQKLKQNFSDVYDKIKQIADSVEEPS